MTPPLARTPHGTPRERWTGWLAGLRTAAESPVPLATEGQLTRVTGLVMEVTGLRLPVGAVCDVQGDGAQTSIEAEVVGFGNDRLYLMPTADVSGLAPGARVVPRRSPAMPPAPGDAWHAPNTKATRHLPMGDGLLGRVIDPVGRPLDEHGPLARVRPAALARDPINAMHRAPIDTPLDTGVRAINALLTVGRGQRIGLFAGAGVGKSVLLGMMARYTSADVIVVGLVGERGREVQEFIEQILGDEGLARAVVVAAPADMPPLLRMQAANYATAIAEDFRDQGKHVLLLMDSLTRYAMAQREIALAIGEPPATKGYPPSCFAKLPQLVERAGNGERGGGSITAFYTVLTEGDDPNDPVADSARAVLDGHIVLTRRLADAGHYPAIDVEQSISRVMHQVVDRAHVDLARKLKSMVARYERNRDLIGVGAYVRGADPELDRAIDLHPRIEALLTQAMHECAQFNASRAALEVLLMPAAGGGALTTT
ncbi:MAG TPA: flagellar protein export ATPase FliI [Burkholderiaceae bacterium]|nr:flagellar protein export ATPase FliI [Burkholderiaceae bacterium]